MLRHAYRLCLVLLALLGVVTWANPGPARAAGTVYTWTGASPDHDMLWTNPANWEPSTGYPGELDGAVIAAAVTISDVPDVHLASLVFGIGTLSGGPLEVDTLNWGGGIISFDVTVDVTATFDGVVPKALTGDLTLKGPSLLSAGTLELGGKMTNGSTFTMQPGSTVSGGSPLTNNGTIAVGGAGTGTATLDLPVPSDAQKKLVDNGNLSAASGDTLQIQGGLTVMSPSKTIGGGGTVKFTSSGTYDPGAVVQLASDTTIAAGTTIQLDDGEFDRAGSFVGSGTFLWTGGTINSRLVLAKETAATIDGSTRKTLNGNYAVSTGTLVLNGPTHFKVGDVLLSGGGARLSNSGTGVLTMDPGTQIHTDGSAAQQVLNAGTLSVSAPQGAVSTAKLTELSFQDTGTVTVAPGSTLDLSYGTASIAAAKHISGGGSVIFGLDYYNGKYEVLTLAAGISIDGTTTVGLAGDGQLAGTGSFVGTGQFLWTAGTIMGSLTTGAALTNTLTGADDKRLSGDAATGTGKFTATGATSLKVGKLRLEQTARIANTGVFTLTPGTEVDAGSGVFGSSGTVALSAPAGGKTSAIVQGGFTVSGQAKAAPGSTLEVYNGQSTFAPGTTFTGGGKIEFGGTSAIGIETAILGKPVTIASGTTLALGSYAELKGTTSIGGSGSFRWTGGTLSGNVSVAATVTTTLTGTDNKLLMGDASKGTGILSVTGQASLLTGNLRFYGPARIASAGTFSLAPGTTLDAAEGRFVTTGTLAVLAPGSASTADVRGGFNPSGTISVAPGARLQLMNGQTTVAAGTAFSGGGTLEVGGTDAQGYETWRLGLNVSVAAGTTLRLGPYAEQVGTGTLTGGGAFVWTGGTISGNLAIAATMPTTIGGADDKVLNGDASTGTGILRLPGPSTLATGAVRLYGSPLLTTSGIFKMSPGTTVYAGSGVFSSSRRIWVTAPAGGLRTASIAGGFSAGHGITVAGGSTLQITSGQSTLAGATELAGGGTVQFGGANASGNATAMLGTGVSVLAGTTLALGPYAEITGTGSLTGAGTFLWTGGTIAGSLTIPATISTTLTGTGEKILSGDASTGTGILSLAGPAAFSKGTLWLQGTPRMSSAGTFTITPGTTIHAGYGMFDSSGTLAVLAPTATSPTVLVDGGLRLATAVTVATGSTLRASNGQTGLAAGTALSGGGTVQFGDTTAAGTEPVTLAANISIAAGTRLALAPYAEFHGTASLVGAGRLLWSGGTIAGNLNVASTVTSVLSGPDPKSLSGDSSLGTGTLRLAGPSSLSGGPLSLEGDAPKLTNASNTLSLAAGAKIQASSAAAELYNAGTLRAPATGSATITGVAVRNTNTLTVGAGTLTITGAQYTQTGSVSVTSLAGGSLHAGQKLLIHGGTLYGFGTVFGSVENTAKANPYPGGVPLTITGTYTQSSTGTLAVSERAGTSGPLFGTLAVTGAAQLNGTLSVSTQATFDPHTMPTVTFLTYGSHTGTFAQRTGTPPYTVTYGTTSSQIHFTL